MSYDLLVFELEGVPQNAAEFSVWFQDVMEEIDATHSYDPKVMSSALQSWLKDMSAEFPDYNDPEFDDDDPTDRATGYTICGRAIHIEFRWSAAELAYAATLAHARKYGLGFFDLSGKNGSVWGPSEAGAYVILFEATP
jgi:hypothetical protein